MKFVYDSSDFPQGKSHSCWLLANGLGGFASTSEIFSVTRNDQGLLIAADSPSQRFQLVHRLTEELWSEDRHFFLSSQDFADSTPAEDGWRHLTAFQWEDGPSWHYQAGGISLTRQCALVYGANTAALVYTLENRSAAPCTFRCTPVLVFAPKGEPPQSPVKLTYAQGVVESRGRKLYVSGNAHISPLPLSHQKLYYCDDEKDGRKPSGWGAVCFTAQWTVEPGQTRQLELVFSTQPISESGEAILQASRERQRRLLDQSGFRSPYAQELARSADAFIVKRAGAGGKTIIAGYPFFSDWGRDTMISLPGCVLARGEYDTAKGILRTFLSYEKQGLLPNLFPEGENQPEYNSADAPLLLINCVWLYYQRTKDADFVREAFPTMAEIVHYYRTGTRYAISMDEDGLIRAGSGLDQVTWMDVRVGTKLPTPRHGKPVEINAYWYNALEILSRLAPLAGGDGSVYAALAQTVKASFREKFWMPDRGYLKDVLSGTPADLQLRCNQIWALSMPFTMLPPEQERQVLDTVTRFLYTPNGLRTLSPEDPEFCPFYGGSQWDRDMAYHQGTIWPFPLGGYYLACLKVNGSTPAAARRVRTMLDAHMEQLLREGCAGQLPEIYDALHPGPSKGCFAQAWSVGEVLRVYEALEEIESGSSEPENR